jgi:hypothetical protein
MKIIVRSELYWSLTKSVSEVTHDLSRDCRIRATDDDQNLRPKHGEALPLQILLDARIIIDQRTVVLSLIDGVVDLPGRTHMDAPPCEGSLVWRLKFHDVPVCLAVAPTEEVNPLSEAGERIDQYDFTSELIALAQEQELGKLREESRGIVLSRNWVVQDLVLKSIEVRSSEEGWLRFDKDRVIGAQNGSPFAFSLMGR